MNHIGSSRARHCSSIRLLGSRRVPVRRRVPGPAGSDRRHLLGRSDPIRTDGRELRRADRVRPVHAPQFFPIRAGGAETSKNGLVLPNGPSRATRSLGLARRRRHQLPQYLSVRARLDRRRLSGPPWKFGDWTTGHWPMFAYPQMALERNRQVARDIAAQIVAYQDQYPGRPVSLVGHSGGAAMAVLILESLPEDRHVTQAILLAAAISPDHDLTQALARTEQGITSFYSWGDVPHLVSSAHWQRRDGRPQAHRLGRRRRFPRAQRPGRRRTPALRRPPAPGFLSPGDGQVVQRRRSHGPNEPKVRDRMGRTSRPGAGASAGPRSVDFSPRASVRSERRSAVDVTLSRRVPGRAFRRRPP